MKVSLRNLENDGPGKSRGKIKTRFEKKKTLGKMRFEALRVESSTSNELHLSDQFSETDASMTET